MTRLLTCLRCGHEGTDVEAALVDLQAEAAREGEAVRMVEVNVPHQLRHIEVPHRVTVPERYGTEWRCRDRAACDVRWQALAQPEPMPDTPPAQPDDEEVAWIAQR